MERDDEPLEGDDGREPVYPPRPDGSIDGDRDDSDEPMQIAAGPESLLGGPAAEEPEAGSPSSSAEPEAGGSSSAGGASSSGKPAGRTTEAPARDDEPEEPSVLERVNDALHGVRPKDDPRN